MKDKYTISIRHNREPNVPPYSAYCKEWDITADEFTIPEALSALFAAINILEEDNRLNLDFSPREEINFDIPLAV